MLREIIVYVFLITGSFFLIVTAIVMFRFHDFHARLHTVSKCLMTGSITILMGCIVLDGITYNSLKLIAIIILFLITKPVAINAIAYYASNHSIKPAKNYKQDIE